jgi:transposase
VIQTVREKSTCRDCERISQLPAPFHPTAAGPNLLTTILFEKFGEHQPLNRQAERYAREGADLSLSTLADQVGACVTEVAMTASRMLNESRAKMRVSRVKIRIKRRGPAGFNQAESV